MKTLNTILIFSFLISTTIADATKAHPRRFPQNQNQMMMYQVQPGDHLAEILRSMGLEPLWGPEGSVQRTIELNKLKSPNQLPPGMWLKIPADQPVKAENFEMDHGVVRKKASTVEVYCPDGSVQTARVYMVPERGPGRPAKVVFIDSAKAICSEAAMKAPPVPVPLPVPVPTTPPAGSDLPAQDPDALDDLDVHLKPESATAKEAKPAEPQAQPNQGKATASTEAAKKEEAAKAIPVEEKKEVVNTAVAEEKPAAPAEDYFADDRTYWGWQLAPQVGYGSNRFEVDSTHFTMNKGFSYGARLEGSWGTRNDRLMIGANYLSASLVNSGVSTDKSTVTMTTYGLGYAHKAWSYRVGMINNSIKETVGVNSINFSGSGTYFSIAHDWKISLKWSFGYELRYATANYKASSNSSLQNDLKGTQIESILGFAYQWGADK